MYKKLMPAITLLMWLLTIQFPIAAWAQWQGSGLDVSVNANLAFGSFTSSPQVFNNRQEAFTLATQLQAQTMYGWVNGRHGLQGGLGYRLDRWAMNRTNLGDILLAIIPFAGGGANDGWPERVSMRIHQISVPVAYSFRISPNADAPVQVSTRLLVMPAFAFHQSVSINSDFEPTPGAASLLGKAYNDAAHNFSLMIAPEVNLHFLPNPGGINIYFGLQPFAADLVRPTREWMTGGLVFRTALGVQIPLVKK